MHPRALMTLTPVVWTDIDSRGRNRRQGRPRDEFDDDDGAMQQQQGSMAPPAASGSSGPSEHTAKRRKKSVGLPAVYYPPALSPAEKLWRDRFDFLAQRGYQLRPRYQPTWTPTRFGNGRHHHSGEDHIMQILPQVLDAIRREDGLVICLKMVQDPKKFMQIKIVEYFSSRRMLNDMRNHVVPFYDTFKDSQASHIEFMVMPVLRRFDDPEFTMVFEVVDFVTQCLEGVAFLHENNVAHHNLTAEHIMMDAKSIIPTGWHFVSHFCEPDGMTRLAPMERKNHSVRYYFVGFGRAYHISPKQKPLVVDIGGSDTSAPELLTFQPYDPFKLDIFTLGNVFLNELYVRYHGLDFLPELIDYMRMPDFSKRPNSDTVLRAWYRIRNGLDQDRLEEMPLRFRNGVKARHVYEADPQASRSRSYKRDISSILNK